MREKRGSFTYYQFQLPFDDAKNLEVNKRPGKFGVVIWNDQVFFFILLVCDMEGFVFCSFASSLEVI